MKINAGLTYYDEINKKIRSTRDKKVEVDNCLGQRYIGCGISGKELTVVGTPGNALGAYLNGGNVTVYGNAQDATGDTMNDGTIAIHGSSGDATGYAMRGGKIFIEGSAGYRTGIHMKEYQEKAPVIVIGGCTGSFLGEYQAGGTIVVLGLDSGGKIPVGNFCGTGMHGGKIILRTKELPKDLPGQVAAHKAGEEELCAIMDELMEFCAVFDKNLKDILDADFYILRPNTKNPYKQLYTTN